jgi:hypothetical protein
VRFATESRRASITQGRASFARWRPWWSAWCLVVLAAIGHRVSASPLVLVVMEESRQEAKAKDAVTPAILPRIYAALDSAPPDVDAWVRLLDGRTWLTDPSVAPFVESMARTLVGAIGEDTRSPRGVSSLAARLGMPPIEACDRYLGRDVRFQIRGSGEQLDWCLVTLVNEKDMDHLIRSLRAVIRGGGIYTLPEDHMALAVHGEWLILGRSVEAPLFTDCIQRLAASPAPSLRQTLAQAGLNTNELGTVGDGRLAIVFSGPKPLSGWSAIALEAKAGQLSGSLRGSYTQSPLPRTTSMQLDVSLLESFDNVCLGAQIDPIATEVDPGDSFFVQRFPALLRSPAARSNLGSTRLLLIGEVDGARANPPLGMRCPAVALAYEVDDAEAARQDQDRMIASLVEHERRHDGLQSIPPIQLPDGTSGDPSEPRSYDSHTLMEQLIGQHPLVRTVSINWQTLRCGDRSWQVYATHPEWLRSVATALQRLPAAKSEPTNPITSAGLLNGQRVASHLRSWVGEAAAFQSDRPAEFARGIELIASVAERFGGVRWVMNQPDDHVIELSLKATLTQPSVGEPARVTPPK